MLLGMLMTLFGRNFVERSRRQTGETSVRFSTLAKRSAEICPASHSVFAMLLLLAGFGAACNFGGSKTSSSVLVTVSPSSAQVNVGITAKFTVNVTGTTNTAVTWKVNGKESGNSTVGTISTTGLYTAPGTVPSPAAVTITAVSQADGNAKGSATVTVLAAATVSVSPAAATVLSGASQQFNATVQGTGSSAVNWSVDALVGGNATLGTIDSNGLYTAPATPPPGGTITVTATSVSDSTQSGSATVSIQFGVGALKGQYSFLLKGRGSGSPLARIGSIVADGEGNITSGIEDVNTTKAVTTVLFNSGTYTIGADGRGTLSLTNNTVGTLTFFISVVRNTHGFLVETDASAAATGAFYQQTPSAFSTSGLSGPYVFDFSGVDTSGYPESVVGRFTSDGGGHLQNGVLDENDNATNSGATSFTSSSYQTDATYGSTFGRGVASIHGLSFVYYIVDTTRAEFLQTDYPAMTAGEILAQQSPPSSLSGFSGGFAFAGYGSTKASSSSSGSSVARGGRFTADGAGNLSSLLLVSNSGGSARPVPSSGTLTGTYTIDTSGNGRGTMTFTDQSAGTFTFVFYLVSSTEAVFQDTSKSIIVNGTLLGQSPTSVTQATLAGNHAFSWGGVNSGEDDFSGQIALTSAASSNASGTIDFNEAGTVGSNVTIRGTFSLSGDGTSRNSFSLSTVNSSTSGSFSFAAFIVDQNRVLYVSTDDKDVIIGRSERQF
jgi:hypothetical protein